MEDSTMATGEEISRATKQVCMKDDNSIKDAIMKGLSSGNHNVVKIVKNDGIKVIENQSL